MARFLNTPESVAVAVRDGRTAQGLAQAELARRAGVGRRFIVDLEAGHPRAELGKVLAVLSALGIRATALPAPPIEARSLHDVDPEAGSPAMRELRTALDDQLRAIARALPQRWNSASAPPGPSDGRTP